MQKKFAGSVEDLKRFISDAGVLGHWIDEGDFIVFHADEGEAFIFWPETGTVLLVGSPESRKHFQHISLWAAVSVIVFDMFCLEYSMS